MSRALSPLEQYQVRLEARRQTETKWSKIDLGLSATRLGVMLAGLVAAWLSLQNQWFSPAWLLLPVVVFGILMVAHERVIRARTRSAKAVHFYERGLMRLAFADGTGEWPGSEGGTDGSRYRSAEHPYAGDLDLFGPGSLFELICVARTRSGRDYLAAWLSAPAEVEVIRQRQAAVGELRDRLDLRERLAVLGGEVDDTVNANPLLEWARSDISEVSASRTRGLRLVLVLLASANIAALLGWGLWGWGARPLALMVLVGIGAVALLRKRVATAILGVERASADLQLLSELLLELEHDRFDSELLASMVAELNLEGRSPGREIKRLQRLVDLLDSRRNAMFAPLGAMLYWTSQLSLSVEAWRLRVGDSIVRWLELIGELEALSSLATYSFEHPRDPFPEVREPVAGELPVLVGKSLGHPLLPRSVCVSNDVELGGEHGWQGYVVSGSNMSGKSTYLRTTGVNVVLALAGAPVRAESLVVTRLNVGASIRVQDSLQEGTSRFYAEIQRLRQVLALTEGELPVYFLLDEILHGTNSHDRRIGAQAVVRAFLERGALGLVTTHDLALARIADDEALHLRNVHFEDRIEDGKMLFDYRLHEGVVERSNALELMRQVGLEV